MDRSGPPRQIPDVEGTAPRFGPGGEIFFRRTEGSTIAGTSGFVYRVHADGTGAQKALEAPVLLVGDVSPDGKWLVAWAPLPGNGSPAFQAFPLDGGPSVTIGSMLPISWSLDGRSSYIIAEGRAYMLSLPQGQALPRIPAGGFHSEQEVAGLPGARRIDEMGVVPGPSPEVYAFYRGATQRNLYRIPIP